MSSDSRTASEPQGTIKRQKNECPASPATPEPEKLTGSVPFFKLPLELRLYVYDELLADIRPALIHNRWYHRRRHGNIATHDPLGLRSVNNQIADDTLQYLFRTFDLGWTIAECSPREADNISTTVRGQWACVHHLNADARYFLQRRKTGVFEFNPVERYTQAHKQAIQLYSILEELGWSIEDRRVLILTIHDAEDIYCGDDRDAEVGNIIPDFLVYLALLTSYFPLLKEIRLVLNRAQARRYDYNDLAESKEATKKHERYYIEEGELRDWYTRERKWVMPQLSFEDQLSARV